MMHYETDWHMLTVREQHLLKRLLSCPFDGRDALMSQLEKALARWVVKSGVPALQLQVGSTSSPASVRQMVPVDGLGKDLDGSDVYFLLHVVEGRAQEVEIFRPDGKPILQLPDADSIQVQVY